MAKVSKEQGQKIFLGILMLVMAAAGVWMLLIAPQFEAIEASRTSKETLEKQIDDAKKEIALGKNVHEKAVELNAIYKTVLSDIPSAAPITWYPPKVSRFFSSMGIAGVVADRGGTAKPTQPGLENFEELSWTISTPNAPFIKFGTALAAYENSEPLIQILSINIDAGVADAEMQKITMNADLLLPIESADDK